MLQTLCLLHVALFLAPHAMCSLGACGNSAQRPSALPLTCVVSNENCSSRATMSSMINALANAAVAAVIASVEEDTEVPVPRRTTRSQSARLNLAATCTFEGFVPANNPNTHVKEGSAWIYRLKGLL